MDDHGTRQEVGYIGSKAYHRHMKQHVQSKPFRIVIITPPELVQITAGETVEQLGASEITDGGVELNGRLPAAYLANLRLRTPSRVLLRVQEFRAGATEELFSRVASMPWELWIDPVVALDVRVFIRESRIEHEGAAAETILAAIAKRFKILGEPPPQGWREAQSDGVATDARPSVIQRVLVHVTDNRCTISLDTSGDHLHLRGYRLKHAGAPVRETLASAILLRSGWRGESPLIDGMCGSGTIPIEAAMIARRMAPGLGRSFLFERWPSFERKTWDYLRRKSTEESLPRSPVPIIATDIDPEALELAMENAERAGVRSDLDLRNADFFGLRPGNQGLGTGLLMMNPPYGLRMQTDADQLYRHIGRHLKSAFSGWQVAILAPNRRLAVSLNIPRVRYWNVPHGGMKAVVAMGRV